MTEQTQGAQAQHQPEQKQEAKHPGAGDKTDETKAKQEEPKPKVVKYKGKEREIRPEEEPAFIQKGLLFDEKSRELEEQRREIEAAKKELKELADFAKRDPIGYARAAGSDPIEAAKMQAQFEALPKEEQAAILREIEYERTRAERDELKTKAESEHLEREREVLQAQNYKTFSDAMEKVGVKPSYRSLFHMAAIQQEHIDSGVKLSAGELAEKMAFEEANWFSDRLDNLKDETAEESLYRLAKKLGPERAFGVLSKDGILEKIQAQTLKSLGREQKPRVVIEDLPQTKPAQRVSAGELDRRWREILKSSR